MVKDFDFGGYKLRIADNQKYDISDKLGADEAGEEYEVLPMVVRIIKNGEVRAEKPCKAQAHCEYTVQKMMRDAAYFQQVLREFQVSA